MLYKNTLVKIKKSFGRYISLLIIVMVGVGFFSGIRASSPDIIAAVDQYYKAQQLMDMKVVSTLGLTDDDVAALRKLNDVESVVPSYSLDVLDQGKAIKVHALEAQVNAPELLQGRMPAKDTEVLADDRHYKLGDTVKITSNVSDKLKHSEFTVVGTVKSPLYMADDYGNTMIGDGKLSSFIFVNKTNFKLEAYSEMYVTIADAQNTRAYSNAYKELVKQVDQEIKGLKAAREQARNQAIHDKANAEIVKNEAKLNDERATGEQKLADAKIELDSNAKKLADGKAELISKQAELEKTVTSQNAEFEQAKTQIASGWKQINASLAQTGMTKEALAAKVQELHTTIQAMKAQLAQLPAASEQHATLSATIAEVSKSYEGLVQLKTSIDTLAAKEQQLNAGIQTFNQQITEARQQMEAGLKELQTNEAKINDGYREYDVNLDKFNTEISDAQAKLADAKQKLNEVDKATWYVYDRDAVIGYSMLGTGTDTITSVANVMPVFFILIVLLMTSNTMARMIVEERSELGTLTSLGYSTGKIMSTYLFYVLSATVFGAISGFFLGSRVIPGLIYATFSKFIMPPLVIQYDWVSLALILLVAVVLMTSVTVFFCRLELKQEPSALLRPVPPKHGQKIWLERISLLWNRMSFTWKVTMRNIFRYKQRVFMTIVGVAGCTALLVAGFGLQDSISGVAERQYGDIFKYDAMIVLKNETKSIGNELSSLLAAEKVDNPLLIKQTTFKAGPEGHTLDAFLLVPENKEQFGDYFSLTSKSTGTSITLGDSGVIITERMADTLKLSKGDSIQLQDADHQLYTATVTDIAENYMKNYIYMSKDLYSKVFREDASYNMLVSSNHQEEAKLAQHLLDSELVVNVTFKDDILRQAIDGSKSLNSVVVMLVVIASLLVLIVLYNLTSINISERKREIATLKVLGFTDKESNQYIYREASILTLCSIGVGLLLGIVFHRFVIGAIEADDTVYFKQIHGLSYVWSALIIVIVSVLMQWVTYSKLKTINMIESLKSVE